MRTAEQTLEEAGTREEKGQRKNQCKVVSEGKGEFNLHPQQTLLANCYSLLSVSGFSLILKLENNQAEDFFPSHYYVDQVLASTMVHVLFVCWFTLLFLILSQQMPDSMISAV